MTETSTKKVKKSELVSTDISTTIIKTASAHLMPDLTGPRAHDDHGDHRYCIVIDYIERLYSLIPICSKDVRHESTCQI